MSNLRTILERMGISSLVNLCHSVNHEQKHRRDTQSLLFVEQQSLAAAAGFSINRAEMPL